MRRPQSTLAIIGLLFGGLLLACLASGALGVAWYFLFGTIATNSIPSPIARP